MHKITLVCSAHREDGLCNVEELLKILLSLEPGVVFQEIRASDLSSLEAQAAARYCKLKSSHQVHVDRYEMPINLLPEIKNAVDRVFDCVEQTSEEYQLLKREIASNVKQLGFGYLNSPTFATQSARMSEIEYETITETHDRGLIHALQWWRRAIQSRELQMVRSIYEYCRRDAFDVGVFLVGAAHRMGIEREIEKYASAEPNLISWSFTYGR
jgi:hypothetical protein